MAVLDILTLPLIDAELSIEDESTSAGRVWLSVLGSVRNDTNALAVAWGRDLRDRSLVVVAICMQLMLPILSFVDHT
jgi:hypothetical protein